jgi:hypothetical protein
MSLLGVKLGMTAAFHLQADGQSERTNQTVETALRCFIGGDSECYRKWVDYLPIIEHEYNSTPQESTKTSPNELRFTMRPRSLADLIYPLEGASDNAERLAAELKNRQDDARDAIAVAQRKQKKYFDSKRRDKEFKVGELVILKFNRFGPGYKPPKPHDNKLAPLGTPLRITKKLSPLSYRLALPADSKIHDVVSIVHLCKYNGPGENIKPLPVRVDDEEEYEVERIDGQRLNAQGVTEYLVKWTGYGDKERTWEPISNLGHADTAIADWNTSRKDGSKSKSRLTKSKLRLDEGSPEPNSTRQTRSKSRREEMFAGR